MSEEKNIKHFTADDIERYWSGKLTPAEMNAMEKAALDDPFLADALEGYENINTATTDINSLKERLQKRVDNETMVVPLKRKKITWLRVAAAIIIIVSVGLFLQQMVFKTHPEPVIVDLGKNKAEEKAAANVITSQIKPDTPVNKLTTTIPEAQFSKQTQQDQPQKQEIVIGRSTKKDTVKNDIVSPVTVPPLTEKDLSASNSAPVAANAERKDESEKMALKKSANDSPQYLNETIISAAKPSARQADFKDKNAGLAFSNKYSYRVVDDQNNPIPFANVMSTRDKVDTYTDIRGNFNLVSSDSVLNVQIKSLGYNSTNYNLAPTKQTGDLVLKEDEETRKQILAQNRKVVSSPSRKDSAELEEPEVGWGFYNTYVANNIKIPENIRSKNTGTEVELKFDVDKTGQPVNIKVTKSSQCKECDEEAIRLLREGPKWKRKNKRKATVSIAVDPK